LAAVSTGSVVFQVVIVGPIVVMEKEGRRYGRMQVGQLEVAGKGKRQT
jgi:hypothetical protein